MNELDETKLALVRTLSQKLQLALHVLLLQRQIDKLTRKHTEAWDTIAWKDETIHEQANRIRQLEGELKAQQALCDWLEEQYNGACKLVKVRNDRISDLDEKLAAVQHLHDQELATRFELGDECAALATENARLHEIVEACTKAIGRQALFIEAMHVEAGELQAHIGEIVAG